jgi:hypothetical protein
VTIGLSFIAKSGDYCRTFSIAHGAEGSGLACCHGGEWQFCRSRKRPIKATYRSTGPRARVFRRQCGRPFRRRSRATLSIGQARSRRGDAGAA